EGAALVTEQLRLEQRLGQRGAVDRDERLGGTARALVDRAGEELLARATLALDQHRRRRRRHLLDEHHRATEGRAATDDGALPQQIVEALLQQLVLPDQLAALERLVDELEQLLAPERLGEEVVGAILHCLDGLLDGAERGEEDDVHVGRDGFRGAQQLEPREARHLQIGEDQIDGAALQPLERGTAVGGEEHAIAFTRQRALETFAQAWIVVGDEQRVIRHG